MNLILNVELTQCEAIRNESCNFLSPKAHVNQRIKSDQNSDSGRQSGRKPGKKKK